MATFTRADVESELIDRCGALLSLVNVDGTTVNGTNASLAGPIREGLLSLGLAPASFATVTDADLAPATADQWDQLLDVAELRTLRNVSAAYTKVDQRVSLGEQKLSQLGDRLDVRIAELQALLRSKYGIGVNALSFQGLGLDFESRWCEDEY
jgi:hypothetical protein